MADVGTGTGIQELPHAQRSPEWFAARAALVVTASRFADVLGYGVGTPFDFYTAFYSPESSGSSGSSGSSQRPRSPTAAMAHGNRFEAVAREAYELLSGHGVREGGLFVNSAIPDLGASPDGLVREHSSGAGLTPKTAAAAAGLLEIKCPQHLYAPPAHPDGIPDKYLIQMMGQMALTGVRSWTDFVVLCTSSRQIRISRVFFSPPYWQAMEARLLKFARCIRNGVVPRYLLRPQPPLPRHQVRIEVRLEQDALGRFRGEFGMWMPYSLLVGEATGDGKGDGSLDMDELVA